MKSEIEPKLDTPVDVNNPTVSTLHPHTLTSQCDSKNQPVGDKPVSRLPLLVGGVSTVSAALLALYFKDIKITAALIAAGATGVFAGLDYYKGADKAHWSLGARLLILMSLLITIAVSKLS